MTTQRLKQIVTASLNRHLGRDPDTGERANVQLLTVRRVSEPFIGDTIHIVGTAWGEPIMARYCGCNGWMIADDHRSGLSADGKRL